MVVGGNLSCNCTCTIRNSKLSFNAELANGSMSPPTPSPPRPPRSVRRRLLVSPLLPRPALEGPQRRERSHVRLRRQREFHGVLVLVFALAPSTLLAARGCAAGSGGAPTALQRKRCNGSGRFEQMWCCSAERSTKGLPPWGKTRPRGLGEPTPRGYDQFDSPSSRARCEHAGRLQICWHRC